MPLFGISAASIGSALKSGVESAKETASNLADSGAELLNFESADGNGVPPKPKVGIEVAHAVDIGSGRIQVHAIVPWGGNCGAHR